jgi:hypothetical protein
MHSTTSKYHITSPLPPHNQYGSRYEFNGKELIVKTNKLAFLKIKHQNERFEFSSGLNFGLRTFSIEHNFIFYILLFIFPLKYAEGNSLFFYLHLAFATFSGMILLYINVLSTKRQIIDWIEGEKI